MASTYIKRTCDGAYTSTFTWSAWVKRSATGSYHGLFCNKKNDSNSNSRVRFYFSDADRLAMEVKDSTSGDDSFFQTNRLFRDVNAWYHIVLAYDTTQSAENDRIKLWINNEEVTSWEQFDRASSGFGTLWSSAMEHRIGTQNANNGTNYYFDGSMSHVHLTYGTAYTPSAFGETDATTGEWKIKTSPSVTYGSQGYFVLKDGNSLTDQSGQSNNFTVGGGTLTKTEDCPSNVFATFNPLVPDAGSTSYHHGNTQHNVDTANWRSAYSTLGMTTGKYYFEALKQAGTHGMIGIRGVEQCDGSLAGNNDYLGVISQGWGLYNVDGVVKNNNSDAGSSIGTYANGDYMGCFLDCDNSKLYFSKNGTMMNTTGYSITAGLTYMFGISGHTTYRWVCNFGNGAFGSTQLTGTTYNGSDGNGIFKYNPNSITLDGSSKSFKSLSTKGLNL